VSATVEYLEPIRFCVAYLKADVLSAGAERKIGAFAVRPGYYPIALLCSFGFLAMSPLATAADYFSGILEQVIKQCLGKLEY
jgi:hypothetical protein